MDSPLTRLRGSQPYQTILNGSEKDGLAFWIQGTFGAARACFVSALAQDLSTPCLIVLPSQDEAEKFHTDLGTLGEIESHLFPEWHTFLLNDASPSRSVVAERMLAADCLLQSDSAVVVTCIDALIHRYMPRSVFEQNVLRLAVADEWEPDALSERLWRLGYRRVEMVEVKGEFARRGGILDIYALNQDQPVRIEFFGDEIDSIRIFDETSQRSIASLEEVAILPLREVLLSDESLQQWDEHMHLLQQTTDSPGLRRQLQELSSRIHAGEELEGIENYMPWFYPESNTLIDYLPQNTTIVFCDPLWINREAERTLSQAQDFCEEKLSQDVPAVPADEMFTTYEALLSSLEPYRLLALAFSRQVEGDSKTPGLRGPTQTLAFDTHPLGLPKGNFDLFLEALKQWQQEEYSTFVYCENDAQIGRLKGLTEGKTSPERELVFLEGAISEGFVSPTLRIAVVPDHEIFGRHSRRARRKKFKDGTPLLSYLDLKEGDYVVHLSHGIGVYRGIRLLEIDGHSQELLMLEYASEDLLYVPTHQIDMVQKYIGGHEDAKLSLDKLGGASWGKTKSRVKESVRHMAQELLKLYAVRESRRGFTFPPDVPWQKQFEAAFPYEETPDQWAAIEEVKRDMERARPMDRLVCGDVGYGKTEVALRAAFKTVMSSKQVAVLVPTTVLAQQHFITFHDRMREFPVSVSTLSRFCTPQQRKNALAGLKKGTVDIVVGTHSLLSKEVEFKDLGLLIIDEEHRFGVKHKERIKQLKQLIDVMTLTATPIPRTLHMSLVGARDLSVINTPPENRFPIETYVIEYSADVVRESILREMERHGQIFYVHNRIDSIASVAMGIQNLVPEARIAVAHGQMPERQLEDIMMDFIAYRYDILVCTTIIESGLDIPNVNTILINRADALGLAQLYQLRGRVGRAQRRAYGYLFYPKGRAITEGAQKRLRVIEEFSDLGAGFKIALRDLEIRGTGNILGPEQHGHISAVGYDLYCKLLDEAIRELKGEEIVEDIDTRINLPVEAYFPDDYVPDGRQKVALYKRIAALTDDEERMDLETELQDRYGPIPAPVKRILEMVELKRIAQAMGVQGIIAGESIVKLTFDSASPNLDPRHLVRVIREDSRLKLAPPVRLMMDISGLDEAQLMAAIKRLLLKLKGQ